MLTKRLLCLGILLMLVTSLMIGCARPPAAPPATPEPTLTQPVVLKYHHQWAPGHWLAKTSIEPFVQGVETRTNGMVKFEVYSADQLVKTPGLHEAVKKGVLDMAITAYPGKGVAPLLEVMRLPFTFSSNAAMLKAWPELEPLFQPEQEANNLRILYPIYVTPQNIFNNVRPIKTLEDFKGLKVHAQEHIGKLLGQYGAATVAIASPERYEALQKRTLDGMQYSAKSALDLKFYEVLKYGTICYMVPEGSPAYINLDTWKMLPKSIQQIMIEEGMKAAKIQSDYLDAEEEKAAVELEKKGLQIYRLPAAERERWMKEAAPIWDAYVKDSGNPTVAQQLVDIVQKYAK